MPLTTPQADDRSSRLKPHLLVGYGNDLATLCPDLTAEWHPAAMATSLQTRSSPAATSTPGGGALDEKVGWVITLVLQGQSELVRLTIGWPSLTREDGGPAPSHADTRVKDRKRIDTTSAYGSGKPARRHPQSGNDRTGLHNETDSICHRLSKIHLWS